MFVQIKSRYQVGWVVKAYGYGAIATEEDRTKLESTIYGLLFIPKKGKFYEMNKIINSILVLHPYQVILSNYRPSQF